MNKLTCTLAEFSELSNELLRLGRSIRFQARGSSMQPLLRDGDILLVKPVRYQNIRVGHVILCSADSGSIVVHRVIRKISCKNDEHFLIKGDRAQQPDGWITSDQIYGIVISITRDEVEVKMRNPVFRFLNLLALIRSRTRLGQRGCLFRLGLLLKKLPVFYWYLF